MDEMESTFGDFLDVDGRRRHTSNNTHTIHGPLSPVVSTPRKTSLMVTPRSVKSEKRSVSFSDLTQFHVAEHALEELYPEHGEPKSIINGMIPEGDEASSVPGSGTNSKQMSFANLDKSSLVLTEDDGQMPGETHDSEKSFSMDLLFQKLMDVQSKQSGDDDGGEGAAAVPALHAQQYSVAAQRDHLQAMEALSSFIDEEVSSQSTTMTDVSLISHKRHVSVASVAPASSAPTSSSQPVAEEAVGSDDPLTTLSTGNHAPNASAPPTTTSTVPSASDDDFAGSKSQKKKKKSVGMRFADDPPEVIGESMKENAAHLYISTKSDVSALSDSTDLGESCKRPTAAEAGAVKAKKKKGVRMQFADDVQDSKQGGAAAMEADTPRILEVSWPASPSGQLHADADAQLAGTASSRGSFDDPHGAYPRSTASVKLPPMSGSSSSMHSTSEMDEFSLASLNNGGVVFGLHSGAVQAAGGGAKERGGWGHAGFNLDDETAEASPHEPAFFGSETHAKALPPIGNTSDRSLLDRDGTPAVTVKKKPKPASSNSAPALSATQFRRHERDSRHLSVAIDLARGIESYSLRKLARNIFFLWFLLPVGLNVLFFGIVPYDYFNISDSIAAALASSSGSSSNRFRRSLDASGTANLAWAVTLVPWLLVMTAAGALGVECYSSIISEIEFSVVVWEDTPHEYAQAAAAAVVAAMAVQALVFGVGGAGHSRTWLAVIFAGAAGALAVLHRMFLRSRRNVHGGDSEAATAEARGVFAQCVVGLGALTAAAAVTYAVFAVVFAEYRDAGGGAVGIVLAAAYPLMRLALAALVERARFAGWGYARGMLCAGTQVTVLAATWHAAFLSLIAGCVATKYELLALALVEAAVVAYTLVAIDALPRPATRSPTVRRISRSMSAFTLLVQYRIVVADDGQMLVGGRPVAAAGPTAPGSRGRGMSLLASIGDALGRSAKSGTRGAPLPIVGQLEQAASSSSLASAHSSSSLAHPGASTAAADAEHRRTFEDDAREVRLALWLGVSLLAGTLFPLVFLVCALVFTAGPNRRLFGATSTDLPSAWETAMGGKRLWSLNMYQQSDQVGWSNSGSAQVAPPAGMWTNAGASGGQQSAWRLLGISAYHAVMLAGLGRWLRWHGTPAEEKDKAAKKRRHAFGASASVKSKTNLSSDDDGDADDDNDDDDDVPFTDRGVTRDLCGLFYALLEYHTNVVALAAVLSLSAVFSVVLPWYGMNNAM